MSYVDKEDIGTERDYRQSVQGIAQEIFDESPDDDGDDGYRISDSVDSSEWIIYNWRNLRVLQYSHNDAAGLDEMGQELFAGCSTMSEVYARAAYYAMAQDVAEAVQELRAERADDPGLGISDADELCRYVADRVSFGVTSEECRKIAHSHGWTRYETLTATQIDGIVAELLALRGDE